MRYITYSVISIVFLLCEGKNKLHYSRRGLIVTMELLALKGLLRERNVSYGKMSKSINVSAKTFCRKINDSSFTAEELDCIAGYLELKPEKINKYFFP